MNILASIHLYPPHHNCGAEWMAHHIFKDLQSRGHNIKVLLHQANYYKITNNYNFDGIDVFPPTPAVIQGLFSWADVVVTHLDYTKWTIHMGDMYRKPVFHLIHNVHTYPEIVDARRTQHIVYNANWAKNKLQYKHPDFILTPPVDYRYYDVKKDASKSPYITLINLNENKGGVIFLQIAEAMPHKQFLGVLGSYDKQVTKQLPNIKYVANTTDIRQHYEKTRILLMPSDFESWGRTATEAMCSGIPVISSKADGLVENCGKAGIYVENRDDVNEWVEAISKLDDEKAYAAASKKAKARSREHDPKEKLNEFASWFQEKVQQYKH